MKIYVIEREIPGAGQLTAAQLRSISQTSCAVIKELGPGIEWNHSYVTYNKIYCIYTAENDSFLKTHAKKGSFPINVICEVTMVISPETAQLQ